MQTSIKPLGLFGLLVTLIFLVAKLFGKFDHSWFLVFAPWAVTWFGQLFLYYLLCVVQFILERTYFLFCSKETKERYLANKRLQSIFRKYGGGAR